MNAQAGLAVRCDECGAAAGQNCGPDCTALWSALNQIEDATNVVYAPCPQHVGYWFHKSTGACDCGAAHSLLSEPRHG